MKAIEKLEFLKHYIDANRQVGHTYAMLHGALNSDAIIIASNGNNANYLQGIIRSAACSKKVVTLNSLDRLRGCRNPLVFDNDALSLILADAIAGEKS